MKIINLIVKIPKVLTIFVLLFLLSFILYFYSQIEYSQQSEKNYVSTIHNEV